MALVFVGIEASDFDLIKSGGNLMLVNTIIYGDTKQLFSRSLQKFCILALVLIGTKTPPL